jgi:hypothetical protein
LPLIALAPTPTRRPPPASWSIANAVEAIQDGRIHIEKINEPFLFVLKGSPAEYKAGLDELAIARGWLTLDRSGTYVKFTQVGAELFA